MSRVGKSGKEMVTSREDESTEKEDNTRDEINTGGHECGK
jgi:hypothetical protein